MAKMPALGASMGVPNKSPTKFGAATRLNASSYAMKPLKDIKTKTTKKKAGLSAKRRKGK